MVGDSVRVVSSDINTVGASVVAGAGKHLFVLLFNKNTAERRADVR